MNAEAEIARMKESKPGFIDPILDTPADTYLKLAIDTTRLRKKAFKSLDDLLKSENKDFQFTETAPFAIASKIDPTKIIMYSNLPRSVDPDEISNHTIGIWTDGRRRKKIEDYERAASYASKREVTTLGKFLTKYSNLKQLGYKDDQIRSFCEKVSIENQPPQIITCETPEDYTTMFKVKTGSCMELGSSYWDNWSKKTLPYIAEDTGIFMSALYHYMPWCKGAYVMIQGVPVARFMLYRTDLSKDFDTYGDVRGSSQNYSKVMDEWLAKKGIKRCGRSAETLVEFSVPGFRHYLLEQEFGADQSFCPMPNMDNQQKDFSVAYCKSSDEFKFYPGNKAGAKRITDTYMWRGFLQSSRIPTV